MVKIDRKYEPKSVKNGQNWSNSPVSPRFYWKPSRNRLITSWSQYGSWIRDIWKEKKLPKLWNELRFSFFRTLIIIFLITAFEVSALVSLARFALSKKSAWECLSYSRFLFSFVAVRVRSFDKWARKRERESWLLLARELSNLQQSNVYSHPSRSLSAFVGLFRVPSPSQYSLARARPVLGVRILLFHSSSSSLHTQAHCVCMRV
jgi:hypothetical protein